MSSEIRLRVGILDGDTPAEWDPFGNAMKCERNRLRRQLSPVRSAFDESKTVHGDLLVSDNLVGESALNDVIGLLVDGTRLSKITPVQDVSLRAGQIRRVCSALKKTSDATYRNTGFHVWVVVATKPDPDDDIPILETIRNWQTDVASYLELDQSKVSAQRIWNWSEFEFLFRMALDSASHLVE